MKSFIIKSDVKEVGVVAVMDGDKILMGKRQDNKKFTNPGGHLEGGEDPKQGALRELKEEAGLEHDEAEKMVSKKVTAPDGQKLIIHAYVVQHDGQKPSSKNDPDEEVKKWEWFDTKNMPEKVLNNLHSPKNVILQKLGIIKALFADLLKAAPHKYLRKYKRGQNWVYVYHEGDKAPRQLPPEAIKHLKELAEMGDEHAKELMDSMGEYSHPKLQLLRELADMGDEDAKKHLKEHHAIDRDQEKLEEAVLPGKRPEESDDTTRTLNESEKRKLIDASVKSMESTMVYLNGHPTSPFVTSLVSMGGLVAVQNRIKSEVGNASTIKEALEKMHKIAGEIERAQPNISTSSNSTIKEAGGYGNATYNDFVKDLERKNLLPEGYQEVHRRVAGATSHDVPKAAEIAARVAAKRAAEAEAERVALAEIHGSMAHHMTSLMSGSAAEKITKAKQLDQAIRRMFGRSLRKEEWPYNFQGMKTKINSVSIGPDSFNLDMQVTDAQGNPMMEEWRRNFSMVNGRPHIYNAYMKVREGARGSVQIGSLINQNQRKLMKDQPNGGTIGVTANIDVGGYNWANHGFSFRDPSTLQTYKRDFKSFLQSKGISLTDADMDKFTEPFHIAAFTDGKKYVRQTSNNISIKLSDEQKQSRSLTGITGEHPLTAEEISSGKSSRMAMNLGKMFMLGQSWSGTWDSKKNTEANKYADKYYEMRDRAVTEANHGYKDLLTSVAGGERSRPLPTSPSSSTPLSSPGTPTPATSTNSSHDHHRAERMLRIWGGDSRTIRMTERRTTILMNLDRANFDHFMRTARLSVTARRALLLARSRQS